MKTLTLAQVREAGRFAWHDKPEDDTSWFSGWSYSTSGVVFEEWDDGYGDHDSTVADEADVPSGGWYHLPGCDCPHCT